MKLSLYLSIIFTSVFLTWGAVRMVASINFSRNCSGYLKRAADANSIELAKENLSVSIQYVEKNNLTSGYTSVIYTTPDEDLGFWYKNLKTSMAELESLDPDASALERSNMLMKLRETLLDSGESGQHITVPDGISVYPYNAFFFVWGLLSFILSVLFGAAALLSPDPPVRYVNKPSSKRARF